MSAPNKAKYTYRASNDTFGFNYVYGWVCKGDTIEGYIDSYALHLFLCALYGVEYY
jgi:hypothetical protein